MPRGSKNSLHCKINTFKAWAKKHYPLITEENDNGEWCFCTEFNEMLSEALHFIEHHFAAAADEQIIDDLLYVTARDNECGTVMAELVKDAEWFSLLCRHSLKTNYINAKWQFVKQLSRYQGNDHLQETVYDFLACGDEYTERLALKALADICPEKCEAYAVDFWNRKKYADDEYQKIMVLDVLYQIHSSKLDFYLKEAEGSDYKYLKEHAREIRKNLYSASPI